ncbi:MAG: PspC domain-containing protein [Nanoarchaeota archaeon]|nr:PspC domain-containing protein [Nanoarchaeota archaeon]MBU0963180.1 PspC domain-containing protein [Nanoarchaeota archaeon]
MKKLTRSKNKIIAGVCAGFAEYLDVDPTIVRLIFAIFSILSMGMGLLIYLVAWILMPKRE